MELWDLYKEYFYDDLHQQLSHCGVHNAILEDLYDYGLLMPDKSNQTAHDF